MQIARAEEQSGVSVEQARFEALGATATYLKAQGEVKDFDKAIQVLQQAMQVRSERWISFRKSIATRAKTQFNHFLSQRGYSGGLEIDHQNKKLVVKVDTDMLRTKSASIVHLKLTSSVLDIRFKQPTISAKAVSKTLERFPVVRNHSRPSACFWRYGNQWAAQFAALMNSTSSWTLSIARLP